MPAFLIQIDGFDPGAGGSGAAVTLYASSVNDERVCHLNGATWWPAVAQLPRLRYDFGVAGTGAVETPGSTFALSVEPWTDFARYILADARVRIWSGEPGDAWAAFVLRFDGRATAQPKLAAGRAEISIAVDDRWLDTPLLGLYAGTTGLEGDAGLKGQPKPLALGAPRYCPGTLIDAANIVYQLSAAGLIEDAEAAFEGLASFGASVGDYASHAALVAATIKAGQWGTCKTAGLVRHGAPPAPGRRFCYHVKGDKAGPDGWVRKPGSIIRRLALLAGGAGKTHDASLYALDTSRPWNISFLAREQITARQLVQRVAASVNAVAGVTWTGQLFAAPIPDLTGAATVTLDATGASLPPVKSVSQLNVDPPFWRLTIEAERTEDVHAYSDVAFQAVLVDRGAYLAAESYREGHIVQDQGTSWLYVNAAASVGNAPPTLPTASNAWWKLLSDPGSSILLTPSAAAFRTADNVFSPASQTITVTAALYNLSGTVSWTAKNPAGTTVKSGTGTSFSLSQSDMGTNLSLVVVATCGWTASAPLTIPVIDDSSAEARATAGENIVPNASFANAAARWTLSGFTFVAGDASTGNYLRANGASATATSDIGTFQGRRQFISYEKRGSAANLQVAFDLVLLNASDVATDFGAIPGWINNGGGSYRANSFNGSANVWTEATAVIDLPDGAVGGKASPTAVAGAGQTHDLRNIRIAATEKSADVTKWVDGPVNIVIQCDTSGTPLPGELSQAWQYKLYRLGVQTPSGVTWGVNSPAGIGSPSISGAGTGTLTIASLGANPVDLVVTANYGGFGTPLTVRFEKSNAPAPTSGGSGGGTGGSAANQTSGYAVIASGVASVVSQSGDLSVTVGSTGQVTFVSGLTAKAARSSPAGSWLVRFQWERWNGSAWVSQGTTFDATTSVDVDSDGIYRSYGGDASSSQTVTGLTVGSTCKMRLTAWIVSGSSTNTTKSINLTGQISLQG